MKMKTSKQNFKKRGAGLVATLPSPTKDMIDGYVKKMCDYINKNEATLSEITKIFLNK